MKDRLSRVYLRLGEMHRELRLHPEQVLAEKAAEHTLPSLPAITPWPTHARQHPVSCARPAWLWRFLKQSPESPLLRLDAAQCTGRRAEFRIQIGRHPPETGSCARAPVLALEFREHRIDADRLIPEAAIGQPAQHGVDAS